MFKSWCIGLYPLLTVFISGKNSHQAWGYNGAERGIPCRPPANPTVVILQRFFVNASIYRAIVRHRKKGLNVVLQTIFCNAASYPGPYILYG